MRNVNMISAKSYSSAIPIEMDSDHMNSIGARILHIADPKSVQTASELLHQGEVIALPTDTVYGLACSANDPQAIQKLYAIKGRDKTKPVAICVANLKSVRYWGEAEHIPQKLLASLLPGAVTVVLYKSKNLDNPHLNPGVAKIGIRIPDFDFIEDVTQKFGLPLALTSANRSSEKSTLNINEFRHIWPKLKAVFDAGQIGQDERSRSASTVIDLSKPGKYKIVREGVAIDKTLEIMEKFNVVLDED